MADPEDISDLWEDALDRYEKLSPKRSRRDQNMLLTLKTPEDLEAHITKNEQSFNLFRSKHGKLTGRLKACMKPFMVLSDIISAAVSASPFAPASSVLGAVFFVLKAAEGVSEVYDWIEELFDKLRDFTVRLDEYVQLGLSKGFRDKIIDVLGCLLEVLACAETTIKSGRWKKYAAVLFLGGDERVKAAFDKLAGLFQSEQSLVLAITYVTNQKMSQRIDEIGKVSDAMLDATQRSEKEKIRVACLNWISTVDFSGQQSDFLGQRQAETGFWFLHDPLFQKWVTTTDQTWALSCPGNPGAGKTTMAATVIHHLSTLGKSKDVAVAYIYCNYQRRSQQTLYALLTTLLRRLVQVQGMVPKCILDKYGELHVDRQLVLEETKDLIALVCKDIPTVYLVIDALDECQDHVRRDLLQTVASVRKQANIRILVTTRFITSIQDMVTKELSSPPQLEVRASDSDVRRYFMSQQPDFPDFLKDDADLCALACDKVVEAAGGMFLLARLHVDQLSAMAVPAHVKKAVSKMFRVSQDKSQIAATYNERYDLALERITHQPGYQAELARATLAWMAFAYRPLTPAELCHAIAMGLSDDQSDLSQDYVPKVGLLVSKCAGLVTVDEQANVVRPVHYTTQEYLQHNLEKWFPDCKKRLASTCLSYLQLDEFKRGGRESDRDNSDDEDNDQDRSRRYPFFKYVAQHWGKHVQIVEDQVLTEILTFLQNLEIFDSINSVTKFSSTGALLDYGRFFSWNTLDPLFLVVHEGLLQTLRYYLTDDHYATNSDSHAHKLSLFLPEAVANGHLDIVQLILDFWADPVLDQSQSLPTKHISEGKDKALGEAAIFGYQQIMRVLIQHGAHVRYCMRGQWAPEHDDDPERTLTLALQSGFEVDARDYFGNTALQIAANMGDFRAVKFLLEHGADPQAKSKDMGPPLEEAVRSEDLNTLELLIDHGIDVNAQGLRYDTALIAAICVATIYKHYKADAIRLLLDAGARPDQRYHEKTRTALHIASEQGEEELCRLLILHGADVNLRSGVPLQSALEAACKAPSEHVLRLLLQRGAQAPECGVDFSGEFMRGWVLRRQDAFQVLRIMRDHNIIMHFEGNGSYLPAIYEAARVGAFEVLDELLKLGADISSRAGEHGNVLHTAITAKRVGYTDKLRCVHVLLDHGADVNGSGLIHTTPLEAVFKACTAVDEIFKVLIEHGAQIGSRGWPALLPAAVAGEYVYIVQYLLTAGVELNNFPPFPNLLAAACKGDHCVEILTIFLDAGADIHMWGPHALHQAASSMRPEAVRWFLQHGVDANAPGNEYSNALLACVSSSQEEEWGRNEDVADSIKTLIEYGADLKIHGPAALELALTNGWSGDVIGLLGGTDSGDD